MARKRKKAKNPAPISWSPVKKPGVGHMPTCKTCKVRPVTDARKDECPFCARNHTSTVTYRNHNYGTQYYPHGFNYD